MPDDLPRIPKKRRPRNKPRDDAWLQQKLVAYRPVYTFRCALPGVFIYAFVCIGISIALYESSQKAFEYTLDYTECRDVENNEFVRHYIKEKFLYCEYHLKLPEVNGQVMFYYGLRNFYQNIRKYEQSRNDRQLSGKLEIANTEECYPFERANKTTSNMILILPIVPCGIIANSMFNDTFSLTYILADKNNKKTPVPMTSDGLLHPSFRKEKYRNPVKCTDEDSTCPGFAHTVRPSWWKQSIADLGDKDTGRALENFDFIQWMEIAALPNFRKLYRKLDQLSGSVFSSGLPAGNYTLTVQYNYNVTEWGGKKLFVVQANGRMGPKAMFQVYAFFVLGLFLLVCGCFMAIVEFSPCLVESVRSMMERVQPPDIGGI